MCIYLKVRHVRLADDDGEGEDELGVTTPSAAEAPSPNPSPKSSPIVTTFSSSNRGAAVLGGVDANAIELAVV